MDIILSTVTEIALSVVVGLLGLASAYALHWLGNAQKAIKDKTDNEHVDRVIDRIHRLASHAVMTAESEVAKNIRENIEDGKITKELAREELARLGRETMSKIRSEVGEEAVDLLFDQKMDVDNIIRDAMESAVERIKSPF